MLGPQDREQVPGVHRADGPPPDDDLELLRAVMGPEQEVKQEVAQEVAQDAAQKVEPAPLEPPTGLEQEALPVADDLPTDATDPLAEPEELLKTKTKSNQSND